MTAVIAISGPKNAGKTTLIEKLLPALSARGLKTAVIKHDGHRFAADREGTDTCRFLAAGACGTAIFDGEKFQAVRYAEVTEEDLIVLYPEADLILLEGFKWTAWPKVEIVRQGVSTAPVCDPKTQLALVTDLAKNTFPAGSVKTETPVFSFAEMEGLADLLATCCRQEAAEEENEDGGNR